MNGSLRTRLACLALLLCVAAALSVVRAEVGVFSAANQSSTHATLYEMGITDGPDPWGTWQAMTQDENHFALNPEGYENGDGAPSGVIVPGSGLPMVAWARNSAGGFDVVYSTFSAGAWSQPAVLAGTAADELDPSLVVGPDGTVHLFYWIDGTTPEVMHRQTDAALSSWSDPVRVSQPGESACRPAGVVHDGDLFVVYEVHDFGYGQTPRQVVLTRREGQGFVPEIVAITRNPGIVRPEVHSHAGRLWVDWIDAPLGAGGEASWTRKDQDGQWEPLRYEPFDTVEERDWFVRGTIRSLAIE